MTSSTLLAPRALYQDVAERLRQQIFARELEPGAWIDELKRCAEMGISRTPLREALKVLAAEGLVTMKVRRGAYVTEMSERDVREAWDDGWGTLEEEHGEPPAPIATEVRFEDCKSAINDNDSPDIPFDRSLNPYRGCEHGCIY